MIHNYTISNLESLKTLPQLKVAQFTLNSRIFPAKRKVVTNLSLIKQFHNADIFIHYDYVYIISRYLFFSEEVQKAIVNEINSIMEYVENGGTEVKGIIMHTDFPLRKQIYQNSSLSHDFIKSIYSNNIWNIKAILDAFDNYVSVGEVEKILTSSFNKFWHDLLSLRSSFPIKVYLENTTKVPVSSYTGYRPGTVSFIQNYLLNNPHVQSLYGMCVDTEHDFAVNGKFIEETSWMFDTVVHLNPIPKEVTPFSLKDIHSSTTLFECSVNSYEFYVNYIETLNNLSIPFVRECHSETMFREWEQFNKVELATV